MVLTKVEGGFQIAWVAESICKRKAYSSRRSENRKGKPKVNNEYLEKVKTESMLFCLPCLCGKVG